jgi:hypothetical protein
MIYILTVWIYGVTIAVIPISFPSLTLCERAGEAFIDRAHRARAKLPGFVCIPIDLTEDRNP